MQDDLRLHYSCAERFLKLDPILMNTQPFSQKQIIFADVKLPTQYLKPFSLFGAALKGKNWEQILSFKSSTK